MIYPIHTGTQFAMQYIIYELFSSLSKSCKFLFNSYICI